MVTTTTQGYVDRTALRAWATAQSRRRHHLTQIAAARGRDKPWKAAAWVIAEWRQLRSDEQRTQVVEALVRLAEQLNGRYKA